MEGAAEGLMEAAVEWAADSTAAEGLVEAGVPTAAVRIGAEAEDPTAAGCIAVGDIRRGATAAGVADLAADRGSAARNGLLVPAARSRTADGIRLEAPHAQ